MTSARATTAAAMGFDFMDCLLLWTIAEGSNARSASFCSRLLAREDRIAQRRQAEHTVAPSKPSPQAGRNQIAYRRFATFLQEAAVPPLRGEHRETPEPALL